MNLTLNVSSLLLLLIIFYEIEDIPINTVSPAQNRVSGLIIRRKSYLWLHSQQKEGNEPGKRGA